MMRNDMKFFDSCDEHVTLADVAADIANDLKFEEYLKERYEKTMEERAAKQQRMNREEK